MTNMTVQRSLSGIQLAAPRIDRSLVTLFDRLHEGRINED